MRMLVLSFLASVCLLLCFGGVAATVQDGSLFAGRYLIGQHDDSRKQHLHKLYLTELHENQALRSDAQASFIEMQSTSFEWPTLLEGFRSRFVSEAPSSVGQGSYAFVREATDVKTHKKVILKIFRDPVASELELVEAFKIPTGTEIFPVEDDVPVTKARLQQIRNMYRLLTDDLNIHLEQYEAAKGTDEEDAKGFALYKAYEDAETAHATAQHLQMRLELGARECEMSQLIRKKVAKWSKSIDYDSKLFQYCIETNVNSDILFEAIPSTASTGSPTSPTTDIDEADHMPLYLAFEQVFDRSLGHRMLSVQPLYRSEINTPYLVAQLLYALQFLQLMVDEHDSMLVHRDLTADNVLVNELDGNFLSIHITGLGKIKRCPDEIVPVSDNELTVLYYSMLDTGQAMSDTKNEWIDGEFLKGSKTFCPKIDVYAVGWILIESIFGRTVNVPELATKLREYFVKEERIRDALGQAIQQTVANQNAETVKEKEKAKNFLNLVNVMQASIPYFPPKEFATVMTAYLGKTSEKYYEHGFNMAWLCIHTDLTSRPSLGCALRNQFLYRQSDRELLLLGKDTKFEVADCTEPTSYDYAVWEPANFDDQVSTIEKSETLAPGDFRGAHVTVNEYKHLPLPLLSPARQALEERRARIMEKLVRSGGHKCIGADDEEVLQQLWAEPTTKSVIPPYTLLNSDNWCEPNTMCGDFLDFYQFVNLRWPAFPRVLARSTVRKVKAFYKALRGWTRPDASSKMSDYFQPCLEGSVCYDLKEFYRKFNERFPAFQDELFKEIRFKLLQERIIEHAEFSEYLSYSAEDIEKHLLSTKSPGTVKPIDIEAVMKQMDALMSSSEVSTTREDVEPPTVEEPTA
eukprot:GILJ01003095.1.p1 GENE.GILJ01003095.1~~GILJ01003095.1.p1  ORF type:complete len:873 (-),score=132.11 GILJ01003095.1:164-2746(-)